MNIKNITKTILCLTVAGVMAFGLTACGKAAAPKNTKTMDKDTLIVGFDNTFVPMGFKDDKGENVGFDIDMAKEAMKRMNKKVEFQPIDWTMKESELNNKNIDLIWNGYSISEERKQQVTFSSPYLNNKQIIVTLATNSKVNTKKDLANLAVGTQTGSSSLEAMEKDAAFYKTLKDSKAVLFDTYPNAFMDLEAGRIQAVVADEILAKYYMTQRGATKYKVLTEDFGSEEYAVGARKDDTDLLNALNTTLDAMKKDGAAAEISKKWFGDNIVK
jgi:polar amino acid transport system substrate-binding protein